MTQSYTTKSMAIWVSEDLSGLVECRSRLKTYLFMKTNNFLQFSFLIFAYLAYIVKIEVQKCQGRSQYFPMKIGTHFF